ncbi:STAS domain-containing protein [Streptomyces sp. NPDC054865]
MFSVVARQDARGLVLALRGDLDFQSVVQLHEAAQAALAKGPGSGPVVADCSTLAFCDSSGIGAFVLLFQQLAGQGRALRMSALPDHMARLFALTGLDQVISVHADTCEALAAGMRMPRSDTADAGAQPQAQPSEG